MKGSVWSLACTKRSVNVILSLASLLLPITSLLSSGSDHFRLWRQRTKDSLPSRGCFPYGFSGAVRGLHTCSNESDLLTHKCPEKSRGST